MTPAASEAFAELGAEITRELREARGTGHTAVDVLFTLARQPGERRIVMLSRRGLLPRGHRSTAGVSLPEISPLPFDPGALTPTALDYLRAVRRQLGRPEADWRDLLRRLASKGVTLFFTSHVLDVVERLCDEVAVIDRGRIVAQGTLDEIRQQREVGQDATLEDVFLKLVDADVTRRDLSWIG